MPDFLLKGTQFDNFEDFKEQMETIPSDIYGENNKLPITTYTEEDYILAKQKTEDLMLIWYVLMVLECFLAVAVYLHKILKNKDKSI